MKSTNCLFALIALLMVQAVPADAQNSSHDRFIARRYGSESNSDRRPSFFSRTNLSDEQLEKLVDRKNQYEKEIAQDKALLRVDYRNLFNMLTKPEVNRKEAMKLHADLLQRKERISKSRIDCFLDSWQMLNDEQRKDLRRSVLERQLKKKSWHHRNANPDQKKAEVSSSTTMKQDEQTEKVADNDAPGLPTAEQFLMMLAEEED